MSSKRYFDDVAQQWDTMRSEFFPESVRDTALAVAGGEQGVEPGALAADLGAGSGFITAALLAAGLRVIAVDQSPAMLEVLREKFPAAETRMGDADALPIETGAVRYAFANMYLHHVEDPAQAIREMARILAPGGRLVITDLDTHTHEFLRTEQHDRWLGFAREDIAQWFAQAGLQAVVVDCVGSNCCADSTTSSEAASVSIFVASGTQPRS